MVNPKQKKEHERGSNASSHLIILQNHYGSTSELLSKAFVLTQTFTQGLTTFYGKPYAELSLEMADILIELNLDEETAALGILSSAAEILTPAQIDIMTQQLGTDMSKLLVNIQQVNAVASLQNQPGRNPFQIEKIRKMLLAMSTDIRVVIIKLVEHLCVMRGIKHISESERQRFAQETLDIYAPLANRLGIGQIKWELEDLALRYLDSEAYKTIAKLLAERRIDRENRVQKIILLLKNKLIMTNIQAEIAGRAKHIYSIYLKMKHKYMNYNDIYDHTAVRILVENIEQCYTVLSLVHQLWTPIMLEFDDYIAHPKPNGYRSIHTAVIDETNHFEIQIRTHAMHEEAERGVAAHWLYKEKQLTANSSARVAYLRQLLDWHQDVLQTEQVTPAPTALIDNIIYVITPAGDILDLPSPATPIDFAYHLHSELGHRCRGAKINGQIVPLIYHLKTGDRVEIITIPQGQPSRDWLNPELGYIKTSRAKNKISHWFKQQVFQDDVIAGKQLFERELLKLGLTKTISLHTIAKQFNLKNEETLFAALNRGNIRLYQVLQWLQPKTEEKSAPFTILPKVSVASSSSSAIVDYADIMTRFAKCCKPVPGDQIIGYITQGRGISIHKTSCRNITHLNHIERLLTINWDDKNAHFFNTDLKIVASDQSKILNDLSALLINEKIDLLQFNSTFNKNQNIIIITITIQVQNLTQIEQQIHHIKQLPGVIEVHRI